MNRNVKINIVVAKKESKNTELIITDNELIEEIIQISLNNKIWEENTQNNTMFCSVIKFIEIFKNTKTLNFIKEHIDLDYFAKTDRPMLNIVMKTEE